MWKQEGKEKSYSWWQRHVHRDPLLSATGTNRSAMGAAHREHPWLPFTAAGCDVARISTSLELAFKMVFFLCFYKRYLFPGLSTKAGNILHYARWAVGRAGHITSYQQRWVSWGTSKGHPSPALELLLQHQCLTGNSSTITEVAAYSKLVYQSRKPEY